uniref:Uncharacterized protein n=1 Tax=Magallana gigas TaxID=29159 RepID=A0A8W8J0S1_MAGGI
MIFDGVLIIVAAVAVILLMLLVGVAVTVLWCCCRKRVPKHKNREVQSGVNAEENQYETLSDVTSVSKSENSGYLYLNSIASDYKKTSAETQIEKLSTNNNKQKKVLVTKTTVTTELSVVDLPEGVSVETGELPVNYTQSGYLIPVSDDIKSSKSSQSLKSYTN